MANRRRNGEKEAFWREAIARQLASGLSVRAFCRSESLREPSFYSWRRTLSCREVKKPVPTGRSRRSRRVSAPKFLPAMVRPLIQEPAIVVELAGGHIVKFPGSTPMPQLLELMLALTSRGNG